MIMGMTFSSFRFQNINSRSKSLSACQYNVSIKMIILILLHFSHYFYYIYIATKIESRLVLVVTMNISLLYPTIYDCSSSILTKRNKLLKYAFAVWRTNGLSSRILHIKKALRLFIAFLYSTSNSRQIFFIIFFT